MQTDDLELLRKFATGNSQTAFATLVERHINLVYSVALRRLGNAHEAEEVTQAVFIILAKKGDRLRAGTILSGWLYQTAQLTAANYRRTTLRRQRREQEAYMQFTQESERDQSWQRLSPLLEEAMTRLGKDERDAVVLRFFENRTIREVATALGLQEAATQKRVNRATEKLRRHFARRGLQVSATVLLASIGANAVHAAPVGLVCSVASTAAVNTASVSGSTLTLIKSTLKIMAWTKMKTAVITVTVIAFAATTAVVVQHSRKLPEAPPQPPVIRVANAAFAFAGYQTPEATMQSMLRALSTADTQAFLACLTPEARLGQQKRWQGKTKEALDTEARQQLNGVTNVRIVEQQNVAADRIVLTVLLEGIGRTEKMAFKKIGSEWKLAR